MPTGDRKLTLEELGRATPEAHRLAPKWPLRLVLDDVRSRHNVGSMFRTADAFGIEGLLLCGFTPCPPHREIEKTALGATLSVPWAQRPTTLQAVAELRTAGYRVLALEQTLHARPLVEQPPDPAARLALVLGNELHGVAPEVIAACDGCLVISQHGAKHSLNVSVCAGIALWWLGGGALR